MRFPWPRKREPDRVERVAEQAKLSKATIDRVDRVLDRAAEIIDDYNTADRARLARRDT